MLQRYKYILFFQKTEDSGSGYGDGTGYFTSYL
jgi:hypothetical protein